MKISELARMTGQSTETIRYYERIGLLPAAERLANNYRIYGDVHVRQLDFIRRCRTLGLGLEEIRMLMVNLYEPTATSANEAHRMIHGHLDTVKRQIAELNKLRESLMQLDAVCRGGHQEGERCELVDVLNGDEILDCSLSKK